MIIRYKSVIIDGVDKTGHVEEVSEEIAERLIRQGYAESVGTIEIVEDIPQVISPEVEITIREPRSEIREAKISEPEAAKVGPEEDMSEWKPGDADNLMPMPKRKPKGGKG